MILDRFRCFAGLAWDAAEALLYSLNTNRVADVLWESARTNAADRLTEKEAAEEVAEPSGGDQVAPCLPKGGIFIDICSPAGGEAPNLPADAPRCTSPDPSAGQPNLTRQHSPWEYQNPFDLIKDAESSAPCVQTPLVHALIAHLKSALAAKESTIAANQRLNKEFSTYARDAEREIQVLREDARK